MPESIKVEVPYGGTVTSLIYPSVKSGSRATIILGHGAGAGQTSRFMVEFAEGVATRGCNAATFNFPYTEHGRKLPDPAEKLEACYKAVIEAVASRPGIEGTGLIIGGKSMGGRIASQVAAAGSHGVSGLVFLGYPLHPPGRQDKLRAEHLPRIGLPMLFVQGSRDTFGTPDELRPILEGLRPRPLLHVIADGDHSFKVPKKGPLSQEQVYSSVLDEVVRWSIEIAANR
jgi:predicted alpha/beta-hydrolase family hydrolase